jgi:hypothetical protein
MSNREKLATAENEKPTTPGNVPLANAGGGDSVTIHCPKGTKIKVNTTTTKDGKEQHLVVCE